ncbi:hypothetical protein GALMADRAFT_509680 [Galerina marginata CBS 339.88]|uniref:Uncharacterized protein n=1 Tax=Galerina marginata (strain CBS 339.88) TaxID=685588 RepID=A0A067T7G7_GALM3|nr:hypothetical protein GALMADRAFT_509680 [Galerina marginata CBS 339.88]
MAPSNTHLTAFEASDILSDEEDLSSAEHVDVAELVHTGDYSSHMEELFEGEDVDSTTQEDESDDEEGFLYSGIDAETPTSYKAQMRDLLGQDHEDDESQADVLEVEKSLTSEDAESTSHLSDEPLKSPLQHLLPIY